MGKELTAFRVDPDILAALREIRERVGIGISEQVRRALKAWIAEHGPKREAASRRAPTRRKA